MNALAPIHTALGNSALALRYMQHVMKAWSLLTAEDAHPETASCFSNIASFLQKAGNLGQAISFYELALQVNRQLLGADHALTTMIQEHLVGNYEQAGRHRDALTAAKAVYKFYQSHLGEEHQKTTRALESLKTLTALCVAMAKKAKKSLVPPQEAMSGATA